MQSERLLHLSYVSAVVNISHTREATWVPLTQIECVLTHHSTVYVSDFWAKSPLQLRRASHYATF